MLRLEFISDTEILLTDDKSINIQQDRDPNTGQLFESKDDAITWANNYAADINETISDSLSITKEKKKQEISDACRYHIYNDGFQSYAHSDNGELKWYNSSEGDQSSIQGLLITVLSRKLGICDSKLYWHARGEDFSEWADTEISQLGEDLKHFEEVNQFKSKAIQNFIDTLEDEDAINAITWDTEISQEEMVSNDTQTTV